MSIIFFMQEKLKFNVINNKSDIIIKNDLHLNRTWSPDELDQYYSNLRHEIGREDTIALARMAALLTFQGFTLSAVGLLMTATWPNADATCLAIGAAHLRTAILFILGAGGLYIAHVAGTGIKASFNALETVKNEWESVLRGAYASLGEYYIRADLSAPKEGRYVYIQQPRTYGPRISFGTGFGMSLPTAFKIIWITYLAACVVTIPYYDKRPKFSQASSNCVNLIFQNRTSTTSDEYNSIVESRALLPKQTLHRQTTSPENSNVNADLSNAGTGAVSKPVINLKK